MKIILASNSKRREKVLKEHGFDIVIDPSNFDESKIKIGNIKDLTMELAKQKALTVAKRHNNEIIVAADTLVYFNGKEIGQQHSDEDARNTLKLLRGKNHEVFTGLCVINTKTGKMLQDSDTALIKLKDISDDELERYISSGVYKSKAGAYSIDDSEFKSFIENIDGEHTNIMGMPIPKLKNMIRQIVEDDKMNDLKELIRTIPNWPKEGIMFRDVTTLMKDPVGFRKVVDMLVHRYINKKVDVIAGIEARGLILGGALAHQLGVGFVPIRKPGKLPAETVEAEYMKEYGPDKLTLHKDAIMEGQNVLIIDDLLATGGTALAAAKLVEKLGGKVTEFAFMVDLPDLGGNKTLTEKGYSVYKMIDFEGE